MTALSGSPSVPMRAVFGHVLVGVDGTEAGYEACRQATVLLEPDGVLELVTVVDAAQATLAGFSAARLAEELDREGRIALAAAAEIADGRATTRLVRGRPTSSLLRLVERSETTTVALGTHGRTRAGEILLGGVARVLLHAAPCSVLVARPSQKPSPFPQAIVVGVDGSPESDHALAQAEALARRFAADLRIVVGLRGKDVEFSHVHLRTPFAEEIDAPPAEALCRTAASVDLLVVGSRGLHGARALGSVSENVAHQAGCSVLVVRAAI